MLRRFPGLAAALFPALLSLAVPAAAAPATGVYSIIEAANPPEYPVGTEALKVRGVDGLLIHLRWNQVSTALGQYNWAALDKAVALAVAADKDFEIGIQTGSAVPEWVTAPLPAGRGAAHATFSYDAAVGGGCTTFTMAAPYDPAYLSAFRDLLRQLARHLKLTNAWSRLSMLKLSGITTTTDELRLPALAQCGGNAVATWQGLAYTPAKVRGAWGTMLQDFLLFFPDKAFNIGFIGINAFPGINEDGSAAPTEDAPALSVAFAATLIADAGTAMPGRLALGFDSLTTHVPPTNTSYAIYKKAFFSAADGAGARLGWQTNELLGHYPGGGAACGGTTPDNAVACTDSAEFRELLFHGIYPKGKAKTPPSQQAVYLELFPQNIVAYPDAVRAARRNLVEWVTTEALR